MGLTVFLCSVTDYLWRPQTAVFSEKWLVAYENPSAEKQSPRESNKALLEPYCREDSFPGSLLEIQSRFFLPGCGTAFFGLLEGKEAFVIRE